MSITSGGRWFTVVALLLLVAAPASRAADPSPDPSGDQASTVVVTVRDGGFHWLDAGVGAAAMFATTLVVLGLVLAARLDRTGNGNH